MAVLDFNDLIVQITSLSQQEKLDLMAILANQIRDGNCKVKKRSILELRGLGKEIWAGVDVQEYVNTERDSWDG